jgi:NADH-quinone oxidoreductase subunit N
MLAMALAILMFSMAGIPPFAGFFGKLYIFMGAIQAELYWLAVLGVLSSVVAAFYYIRIVQIVYFEEAGEPLDKSSSPELSFVITASGLFVAFFFVYPTPVLSAAAAAAASLFAG